MRAALTITSLLLGLGCRQVPAVVEPAPAPAPEPITKADDAKPTPAAVPTAPAPYELAWTAQLEGWTQGVDISGAGDPVFIVDRNIHLLARHDGAVLESGQVYCSLRGRLHFIDDVTAVIACSEDIIEIGLPGLTVRRAYTIPPHADRDSEIGGADIQATAVAYGTHGGTAVVLLRDGSTYVPSFSVARPGKIESLALSRDARTLAVGFEGSRDEDTYIELFDVESGSSLAKTSGSARTRVTAMSFSADGSMVFANAGIFEAGILDVSTGAWKRNYRVGSWVSESVWVRPDVIAGAGSDGISLFPVDGGEAIVLEIPGVQYATMESVGASEDGSMFCTGERRSLVACWTNRPLAPSSYKPRAPLVR